MFEKDERLIGIASAPLNAKASYKLRSKYGSDVTSRIFRATSFCRHLGILPDRTIMFRDPKIENGVLVLDLKTTVYAPKRATPIVSDMPEAGHALPRDREESSKY
jgi:hypothetical protein